MREHEREEEGMMFMNEWDVEEAVRRYAMETHETPNLAKAALNLQSLMYWTNRNSDGWAYWAKPLRAAKQLMILLQRPNRWNVQDVTEAEVKKALVPVKAFLTRQGVAHEEVLV